MSALVSQQRQMLLPVARPWGRMLSRSTAAALGELKAGKSVGAAEADLIFRQCHGRAEWREVYGDKPRWSKRTDALRAIETSFVERLTQAQKDEQVAKATPW